MKKIVSILIVSLLIGCSSKSTTKGQNILNQISKQEKSHKDTPISSTKVQEYSKDTRVFKNVYNIESLIYILKRFNYRYKIVCIDTRNWTKHKNEILKTRKIVEKFGKKLKKKAIIANLIYQTSKKRAYVQQIQKDLNTYYNLDNKAPFLVFYKKNRNKYKPYKIVPIASMSKKQLENSLYELTKAITMGKSNQKIYANLEKITAQMYALK